MDKSGSTATDRTAFVIPGNVIPRRAPLEDTRSRSDKLFDKLTDTVFYGPNDNLVSRTIQSDGLLLVPGAFLWEAHRERREHGYKAWAYWTSAGISETIKLGAYIFMGVVGYGIGTILNYIIS
ncbi:MAG: hypothetical protein JSW08_03355 [archaeon]|nr:MAG: hypothetical protein JSW08_03355 [archaeon]